jgi:hypothetical protein
MAVTAALALAGAADVLRLPTGAAPVRLGLVIVALAVAWGGTLAFDHPRPRPYWQMALLVTLILLPIVSLQASVSRTPFIAVSRGSAGPLLWLTLATAATLCGLWLFAVYQSTDAPENSALLFLPAAVIVPAILGAPGAIDETAALTMVGETAAIAAGVIFVGLLAPGAWRPLVAGAALPVQFVALWLLGRRLVLGSDGGAIVPVTAIILLALAMALTVLAPLGAHVSRRFFQTVDEEPGETKPASVPPRGARRPELR